MDNQHQQDYQQYSQRRQDPEKTMEAVSSRTIWCPAFITVSMIFALLAAMGFLIIYLSLPFGALAIVFALLSRGNAPLAKRAKHAIIISVIAMSVSSIVTGYAFYKVWHDPQLKAQFNSIIDYYLDYYGLRPAQEGTGSSDAPAPGESLIDYYLGHSSDQTGPDGSAQQASPQAGESLIDYYLGRGNEQAAPEEKTDQGMENRSDDPTDPVTDHAPQVTGGDYT